MHVVAAVLGTSATALRFPSLCAMVIAAGFVAATGRRAAALALAARTPGGHGRPRAGRPGADRAVLRPAVRHRAVHDLLRADGQVVRDRDDVRRDRLLPAAAGLARRPLAVVAGVRRGGGADRPVQHLRAADRGRARGHAAAHGRPRPDRARTPGRPDPAALAGRVRGRSDRARAAARPGQPPAGADRLAEPAHAQRDGAAAHQPRRLPAADRPVRAARAGRPARRLAGGPLAAAQPGRDRAAVAGRPAVRAGRGVVRQAGVLRALHRVLPAGAGHPGRRGADRAGQAGGGHAAAPGATGPLAAGPAAAGLAAGRAGRRGARRAAGRAAAGDQADRRPPGQPAAGLRHRGRPRAARRRGVLHPGHHARARHRVPGAVRPAARHRAERVRDRLGHPDRHRDHQPRAG